MGRFAAERLHRFAAGALARVDVPAADADLVAATLIASELDGRPSHGLLRLPFLLERLRAGLVNPQPSFRVFGQRAAAALLDADNGLGPVAGARAADLAVERASAVGVGLVGVRRSNHLGSLGFYLQRVTARRMVGLAFTNTPPAITPPGGTSPYLGTNPIAAGFPTSGEPVVVDMATSQVARGDILRAARLGEPIPEGWALDAEGQPTTDAEAAIAGSLLPLGGHKGFALALLVEALSGVLTGAGIGPEVGGTFAPSQGESNVGHCFLAIDPGAIGPGFVERMDRVVADVRRLGGRAPGDRRHSEQARHLRDGIELPEQLLDELERLTGARP